MGQRLARYPMRNQGVLVPLWLRPEANEFEQDFPNMHHVVAEMTKEMSQTRQDNRLLPLHNITGDEDVMICLGPERHTCSSEHCSRPK